MDVIATVDTRGMVASFAALDRSIQGRAIRYATDAAAGVIKQEMVSAAPVRSGATKRSILVRKVKVRGGQKRVIGPSFKAYPLRRTKKGRVRVASKKTVSQAFGKHVPGRVAHLVEGGHGGPRPAPAHPWMGPAFRRSVKRAERKLQEKLWSEIRKGASHAATKAR